MIGKFPKGALDPSAQAQILDRGIRSGLITASRNANSDPEKRLISILGYMGVAIQSGQVAAGGVSPSILVLDVTALTVMAPMLVGLGVNVIQHGDRGDVKDMFRCLRLSPFIGVALDRYVAGVTAAKLGTYVKIA